MRVVLLAGEASGDLLGGAIVAALKKRFPHVECLGVTGPRMREAGCRSIGDIDSLSVMGLVEVLRVLPRILRFRRTVHRQVLELAPDVVVGIDAPDFNLPLERRFRDAGLATVHVVSPTIWAWRPKRRFRIARAADAVLCLYPFEPACYDDTPVRAEFIGHPLADELSEQADGDTGPGSEAGGASREAGNGSTTRLGSGGAGPAAVGDDLAFAGAAHARGALGISPDAAVLGVLPGSRQSEIARMMPVFAGAAARLAEKHPGIRAVVPVAHRDLHDAIAAHAQPAPGLEWQLVDGDSRTVMRASELLLVTSGTVTLEALLLGCPMVVSYRASAATAWLLRRLKLLQTDFVSLPNILTGQQTVPELLQEEATPEHLAEALAALWRAPELRAEQRRRFAEVRATLRRDAGARAAEIIGGVAQGR